jgi:Fe-S-cluster containining protein
MDVLGSAKEIRARLNADERAWFEKLHDGALASAAATIKAVRAAVDIEEKFQHMALLAHVPHESMDLAVEQAFEASAEGQKAKARIACKKGCHFCCHVNVMAMIPEAFLIASFIRYEERTELEDAVRETAPKIAGLTPQERHRTGTPCPLLDADGACGVHALRPNACRAYYSPDARLCEASLDAARHRAGPIKVPTLAFPHQIAAAFYGGVTEACAGAGLQSCGVELTAALDLILGDESTMSRWLAGEEVFEEYKKD